MSQEISNYDVCIIGASIAGNYLTYILSDASLKIAIIEEHKSIGYPFQCAGIVSKKLNELLSLPRELILNRVKVAKLVSPKETILRLYGDEEPYIIDRVGLDKLFYQKSKDLPNIDYLLGEKFKAFVYPESSEDILVFTSNRRIRAKILVGCDGPLSSVAQQLGISNNVIYATQIRIKADFNENQAEMYFDEAWNDLFGWIVPEGNNVYRIGLACSKNLSRKFQTFLTQIGVDYTQRIDQQGGIIPIGLMNTLAFDNILLLGDAACQVKATTGGGIIMLLNAARYAARCILKCFKHQNYSENFIKNHYQIPCKVILGKQLKFHYLIRLLFQLCSNKDMEVLFKILGKPKIKEKISLYGDMDFPKRLLIRLLVDIDILKFLVKFIIKKPRMILKTVSALI
jgi:geranylgeranyl reductase family protein